MRFNKKITNIDSSFSSVLLNDSTFFETGKNCLKKTS